jgi:hypothetical protein
LCPRETIVNEKDKQTMETHGITCKSRNVFFYKEYKYDRLADAVRYAEIDAKRVRHIDRDL